MSDVAALAVEHVTVRFGGVAALDDVSFTVPEGAVAGLVGPNGAGKTTLFSVISGLVRPDAGRVVLHDRDISRLSAVKRARLGLARTFQRLEVFGDMTVRDNVMVAAEARAGRTGVVGDILRTPRQRHDQSDALRRTDDVLELLGLGWVADRPCGELPVATARTVELGRALVTDPDVVLLDEPSAGLDPEERQRLSRLILRLSSDGVTILVVEHDMDLVMTTCDLVHVLDFGRLLASGTPEEIRADPLVTAAFLGEATEDDEIVGVTR